MTLIQLINNVDRLKDNNVINKLFNNQEDNFKILHVGYMQDMFYVQSQVDNTSNFEHITDWFSRHSDFFDDDYLSNIEYQRKNPKYISNYNGNKNISDFWLYKGKIRLVFVRGEGNRGTERWYLNFQGKIFLKTKIHLEKDGYVTDLFKIKKDGQELTFYSEEDLIYYYLSQVLCDNDVLITNESSLINIELNYFKNTVGKFIGVDELDSGLEKIKKQIFLLDGIITDKENIYNQLIEKYFFNKEEIFWVDDLTELLNDSFIFKGYREEIINFNSDSKLVKDNREIIKLNHDFNNEHLLSGAGKYPRLVELLNYLAGKDYILYHGTKKTAWFIKRRLYDTRSLKRYKNVFYQLDLPENKRVSQRSNKLLVFFLSLPPVEGLISNNPQDRAFTKMFVDIQRSLVKDTFVLRIADLNLVRGSFYVNSVNFPDYEQQIQCLIHDVMNDHNIDIDNVVTYGVSRGGVGALIHGTLLNSKIVAVDPIINDEYYFKTKQDVHYVGKNREMDLTNKFERSLNHSDSSGVIVSNHFVQSNWKYLKDLELSNKVKLIDVNDSTVTEHASLSRNIVPEQLMYLNMALSKMF